MVYFSRGLISTQLLKTSFKNNVETCFKHTVFTLQKMRLKQRHLFEYRNGLDLLSKIFFLSLQPQKGD